MFVGQPAFDETEVGAPPLDLRTIVVSPLVVLGVAFVRLLRDLAVRGVELHRAGSSSVSRLEPRAIAGEERVGGRVRAGSGTRVEHPHPHGLGRPPLLEPVDQIEEHVVGS